MPNIDKIIVNGTSYDVADMGARGDVSTALTNADAAMRLAQNAVRYDAAQTLSDANQATARANIGAAADADVDELKSAIIDLLLPENFDFSTVTKSHFSINSAGQYSTSVKQETYTINLARVGKVVVTALADQGAIIAFLNTYNPVVGQMADFSTKYNQRVSIDANSTVEYDVLGDMNYMFVLLKNQSGVNMAPTVDLYYPTDTTLTEAHAPADAKATGEKIGQNTKLAEDTRNAIDTYGNYQMLAGGLLPLLWYPGRLGYNGEDPDPTAALVQSVHTDYISVTPGLVIKYKKTDLVNVLRSFEYDSNKEYIRGVSLRAANTYYTIGNDTAFIRLAYLYYNGSPVDVITPQYAYETFYAETEATAGKRLPIGLHTMPKNTGVLNAIKRARQMTDIKWSVASDIDRVNIVSGQHYSDPHLYFQNKFAAGREYEGLPYSEKNFIGIRKGITQFVTSASNERSKECTSSVYTGDNNVASYFGTVCVTLVAYALHAPQLTSPNFTNMVGLTKLYDLYSDGVYHNIDDLELCDVLWEHGHVGIVTDIIRDRVGSVTYVEVSESTKFGSYTIENNNGAYGGKCRRKNWPRTDFLEWFRSFGVYRYDEELLAGVPYDPNKYVPMVDEPPYVDDPLLPCMPEEGDHAYFYLSTVSDRSVKIIIRDDAYTHLRVKQNGVNYALIDVTGLTEATVECAASTEAVYEAYLCNLSGDNDTSTSASCFWAQLGRTSSATMQTHDDGSITFTFVRQTDVAYPIAIVYNGTNASVQAGIYSPVTEYIINNVESGYKFTVTVTPPSGVTSINNISIVFDCGEYGQFPTSTFTPTVVTE